MYAVMAGAHCLGSALQEHLACVRSEVRRIQLRGSILHSKGILQRIQLRGSILHVCSQRRGHDIGYSFGGASYMPAYKSILQNIQLRGSSLHVCSYGKSILHRIQSRIHPACVQTRAWCRGYSSGGASCTYAEQHKSTACSQEGTA